MGFPLRELASHLRPKESSSELVALEKKLGNIFCHPTDFEIMCYAFIDVF